MSKYVSIMPGHFLNCFVADGAIPTKSPKILVNFVVECFLGVRRTESFDFGLGLNHPDIMTLPVKFNGGEKPS
jgi:hypothetical protein